MRITASQAALQRAKETEAQWWAAWHTPNHELPHGQKVTLEEAQHTTAEVARIQAELEARPAGAPPVIEIHLIGRIDEFMEVDTTRKLYDYLLQLAGCVYVVEPGAFKNGFRDDAPLALDQPNPFEDFRELVKMFDPLGLEGTYMVTGIEGKYYDGYVPGDPPGNDAPWPLELTPNMRPFDIMLAVEKSEANGYPNVNHVWFESMDIDPYYKLINFDMGS